MAEEHNESPGKSFSNSCRFLLGKRQTDRADRHADRPPDGLITGGAHALQQQGAKRKTGREREIKKREDPGVWESEAHTCERRRGRSANGLASVGRGAPPVDGFSARSQPHTPVKFLVKVEIRLCCLQETLDASNWVSMDKQVNWAVSSTGTMWGVKEK